MNGVEQNCNFVLFQYSSRLGINELSANFAIIQKIMSIHIVFF